MKQIKLSLKSKDYNITLEDEFVGFFESEFKRIFNENKLLDSEDLLRAFVQMTYEKYQNDNLQKSLINKIDSVFLSND